MLCHCVINFRSDPVLHIRLREGTAKKLASEGAQCGDIRVLSFLKLVNRHKKNHRKT